MEDIYLSCTTCALRGRGRDEIEETFRYAPAAGYKHWGLAGPLTNSGPGLIQWLDVKKIKRRMKEVGLLSCTEVYAMPIPTRSDAAARLGAEQTAITARVAVELDCPRLVFSGASPRVPRGVERTILGVKRLLDLIHKLPVKVCLEPHMNNQILWREDYDRILSEVDTPQVGITVDTGHFHARHVDWKALIRKYPRKIYNVHLKDHIDAQSVCIGKGEIDLHGLVAVLREVGYRGPLAVELEVTDPENLHKYIGYAFKYMTRLLQGKGCADN